MTDDDAWSFDPYDIDWPRALLVALVVAVAAAGVTGAATSDAAFGAYNYGWDGASELRTQAEAVGAEVSVVRNTRDYDSVAPSDSVAVVLSPDDAYSPEETARVAEFVDRGGTLVVAADVGRNANPLLAAVGTSARIDGTPVRDERHNYRTASLPVATNSSDHPLVGNVSALTLNYGTVVRPGGATVLVNTSEYAYLDRNRNGTLDSSETPERRPVATVERVGAGRVVVVSDPSVFVNAMLDRSDNRAFARSLFATGDRVLLDYSHSAGVPPLVATVLDLRASPLAQVAVGAFGLALVGVWTRSGELPSRLTRGNRSRSGLAGRLSARIRGESASDGRSPTLSTDEVVAAVERRHPEWSDDRVRRVARRLDRGAGDPNHSGRGSRADESSDSPESRDGRK
ncbi:DUF4350 domain-containing protein [Halorussus aquaticus]|uniref:DUF4350 domain-containing protein n=1 Tax=Halorussus aquaticus TaxID=2953748 RepID=A0ABD5PZ71_9EURY|nr:DUF4350 domain-containing protein [Halorussus aquaticus]